MFRQTRRVFAILPVITVIVLLTVGCQSSGLVETPDEVTVQLKWYHQAQFAGFYVADQNGYYAAEGLSVNFIEGGPQVDLVNSVLDGTAQFAVAGADTLIVSRSEGKPLGAIAAVFRRNPLVFFAMADSNITRPQDFIGKTLLVTPFHGQSVFTTMMDRVGVSSDQYTVVCCELEPFFSGDIDVSEGYLTNEILAAQEAGYKVNIIYPDDYGVHFYADTIFTTDNFIKGGPEVDLHNSVLDGTAQFAVAAADTLIISRSEGKPLGAIAAVFRRNPLVLFAMADSNITGPKDFIGKRLRLTPFQRPFFTTMMDRVGVSSDQYTVVCCELEPFFSGDIDVSEGYLTNEVLAAQAAGYKLNIIYPEDYGVHTYADTIIASDDLIANSPDLVRRFLLATLKGWTWAIENPEDAAVLALNYDPALSPDLQKAQMLAGIPLVHTGENKIGWMRSDVWQGMLGWLLEQGVLTEPVELDEIYIMKFLQQIYSEGGI